MMITDSSVDVIRTLQECFCRRIISQEMANINVMVLVNKVSHFDIKWMHSYININLEVNVSC